MKAFGRSLPFVALLGPALRRGTVPVMLAAGVALGLAMYVVNLYAFTYAFPWFAISRGPITLATHAVFGAALAASARVLLPRGR